MNYNKLVRDKIIERIEAKGEKAVFHIADDVEYWDKLREKLREEIDEFLADESLAELADVSEVLDAMMEYKNFSNEMLLAEQEKKALERGKFTKRIILDEA